MILNLLSTLKTHGRDFDKDSEAPFGTVPWMKDHSNDAIKRLMAIVLYLVSKYPDH